jgi:hypothetical protein
MFPMSSWNPEELAPDNHCRPVKEMLEGCGLAETPSDFHLLRYRLEVFSHTAAIRK